METLITPFPDAVPADAVASFQQQYFTTFGPVLSDEELVGLRFAYSRVWDRHPVENPGEPGIPGHRALRLDSYCDEPDMMKLIGNPYFVRLAASLLQLEEDDLECAGGWAHTQRMLTPWTYDEWKSNGWHQDAQPTLEPLGNINIWIYLDDCSRYEGVTQVLVDGCETQRENLRQGRYHDDGIGELWEAQASYETGTWGEAPAGGGLAWGGFAYHRISPNVSGKPRRLVTYEYHRRPPAGDDDTFVRTGLTPEQRAAIRDTLPSERKYLMPE